MKSRKVKNIEFGMLVTFVLLIVTIWKRNDWYIFAIVTLVVAMLVPVLYTPFAWLWFRMAKLLEETTSKIIVFLIFFIVITPVGIIRRFIGKDTMQLKRFHKDKGSVFVERDHRYMQKDMERQF